MTLNRKLKPYQKIKNSKKKKERRKKIKNSGKSNYTGKYKSQHYCIFGL